MKKFFGEFKKFITRGNILDLAVGVIVGGAFTAIVTSLTNNIIRPLINWIISLIGGKEGLSSVYTILVRAYNADGTLDLAAIIDFFIISLVVFTIVKAVNASRKAIEDLNNKIEAQTKKEVIAEKKEIKAKAKAEGRKFKVVWAEHVEEKKRIADEKAKREAEAKARKEAEEKANNPTQEELLKQIRDLLIENKELKKNKKSA